MINVILFPFRILQSLIAIIVIGGVAVIFTPLFFILAAISVKNILWIQKVWSFCFFLVCGARLVVTGRENVPPGGVVYLYNHTSFLDIPALVLSTRGFIYYVAKKELGMIPVVGWCIRSAGTLMMPRKDFATSVALYEDAKLRLARGEQFMIAPEGTRNRGEGIGPFKSGPFHFAMSCQADLIPVIIKGTKPLWPPQDLTPNLRKMTNRVHVHFCPKISTKDWTEENRKQKMQELRELFEKQIAN